jgi:hypothetical protein
MLCTPQLLKICATPGAFETSFENQQKHDRNRYSHDQTDHEVLHPCEMVIPQTDEHNHQHYCDYCDVCHSPIKELKVFADRHDAFCLSCLSTFLLFG